MIQRLWIFQKLSVGIVTAQAMRAESDAESLVEVLVDHDSAFGKRDSQMRRLDLKNETLEGDGIIVTDSAFLFD